MRHAEEGTNLSARPAKHGAAAAHADWLWPKRNWANIFDPTDRKAGPPETPCRFDGAVAPLPVGPALPALS